MKKTLPVINGFANVIVGLLCLLKYTASQSEWNLNGYISPSFIDTGTNITAYVGSTATLPCSVANLGTKKVVWKRWNEEHPLTIGDFVFTNDPRYYIDHPDRSYQWNLVIKDVTKDHAGVYDCQISTKEEMYRAITLNVIHLPPIDKDKGTDEFEQIIVIQISGPNFTEKGDPIRISCNASSDSTVPDFMDWFLNGRKLKTDTEAGISITEYRHRDTRTLYSTLEIRKSTMDDAGTYICRNSRRDVVSHHVIILNADSNHEKRGFQDKSAEESTTYFRTSKNSAANVYTNIYLLLFLTCIDL